MSSYGDDYYAWNKQQAATLRAAKPQEFDWQHIADELEMAAGSVESALESHLANVLLHLLKWRYQESKRTRSWQISLRIARNQVERRLGKYPSLKSYLDEAFGYAYETAYAEAIKQMELKTDAEIGRIPERCEWTLAQVRDPDFLPPAYHERRRARSRTRQ
jgi:hypothetical protein